MKQKFSEKSKQEKIAYIIIQVLRAITILVMAYVIFLRIKTGQHVPTPMVLLPLIFIVSLSRIGYIRKSFQETEEGKAKFRKILVRSVILALIITVAFVSVAVYVAINTG